ncbi:zinc chelation protein SecC [Corallococcus exercitus]|uniref:YecA family protein n=1 Tax=Corallococcus exercitus TaxID=2316736 RepID=UPI000EA1450E|nr:SEC-C domain-containing protein [Corallococcus exercitus]RKG72020.1 zinc chelation protein SecC [Corallococcus exercitus]
MSPSKPGRNDPCPCGSGKKYKACHAAEDRAKAAPPPTAPAHPLKQDLEGAMALLGDADVSRLSQALEQLGVLLASAGPQPGLRYDDKAFSDHVGQALAKLAAQEGLDAMEARNSLRLGVVRELGTRSFQEKLGAGLLTQAARSGRTPEERRALCVGALLATAAKKTGKVRPEDNPVLDVVFDVQFREWSQKHAEVVRKYESLVAGMEEQEALTPEASEALRQAEAGELDALVKHVQADPALVERISREAKERAQRVEAKLRDPATPSVFSPEEELWLTCVLWEPLRAMKSQPKDPEGRRQVIAGLLRAVKGAVDPEFLEGMLERMRAGAKDPAADEPTREWLTDAAIAFEAEPARLVLAALLTARQEARGRSAEEMVALADLKALPAWTPEQLEPYRQLLEKEGRAAGAWRIRRAQEWLHEHPVQLDAEA